MKHNENELRKALTALLGQMCANVHYKNFPKPAVYPYFVYDCRQVGSGESGRINYQIDIDVISKSDKTTIDLSDAVMDMFDHCTYSTEKLFFHAYNSTAQPVVEDDKGIARLRIVVELFYYSKEA